MESSSTTRSFRLTMSEAKRLRKCWACGETISRSRNASSRYCSDACKMQDYRARKADQRRKESCDIGRPVTDSPAIGEENVTPLWDRWGDVTDDVDVD